MAVAAGGIRDGPVGGHREVVSSEEENRLERYHHEPVLLLTLLCLPLHGSHLHM